jgi:hypothetical protein
MKKFLIIFLISFIAQGQDSNKVWSLLLENKREEARKVFDKNLKSKIDSSVEVFFLDALIDIERGRLHFDDTYLKKLSGYKDAGYYLYPLFYSPICMGHTSNDEINDLTYKKIDYLASSEVFKNIPIVKYFKAILDRRRLDFEGYNKFISELNGISEWQFCGVFENVNESGLDIEYEPEYTAFSEKPFNANSNGQINWYNPEIKQNGGYHFYVNEKEYGSGIIYAQTFIENDTEKEVILNLGTSGPIKIFLNDIEIYSDYKVKNSDLNDKRIKFNLKKGISRLLLKSSTSGENDYFFASITDEYKKPLALKYYDTYKPYNVSNPEEINAVEIPADFEKFLEEKVNIDNGNVFNSLLLFNTYLNNRKYEKAYQLIEPFIKKYPNSSLLKINLLEYYKLVEDLQKVEEINKFILQYDENYYYSIIKKLDNSWAMKSNINEVEMYRDKAKNLYSPQYRMLYDFFIAARNSNSDAAIDIMHQLVLASHNNEFYMQTEADLFNSVKNDKEKTIAILEKIASKKEIESVRNSLINLYYTTGKKEKAKELINRNIKNYPYFNHVYNDAIVLANNENNYQDVLAYTAIGLKNFPYSFTLMEKRGLGFNSLKNTLEAQKCFERSLIHNSSNSSLRKTLYDLIKVPDEIAQVSTKNIYDVIKQRRNTKIKGNYGVTILLDEYIINVLPEGGRKNKAIVLYEVTDESGIDELKEYSVNGNNLNILKAEVVKPDGIIIPGEKNYGTIVFTNLNVNDVVYIEYETMDNSYGRFYKDFTTSFHFNGAYPAVQAVLGIIYPENIKFDYNIMNGDVKPKTSKINRKIFTKWERNDIPAMPLFDNYSPKFYDVVNQIDVSSIKSWAEISNWYADLVKKNIKVENTALEAYMSIFPNGTEGLSDEQVAYKIYKYIGENINYSSVDFRQSGYVPQKPSKTVSTKLGDCKDVSTLFVAMAQKAGLKTNLVLVRTNENGINSLRLPSIDFNHCIVRVVLNNKDHFLELTNKYLPFKALPMTLYRAKALVISLDKNDNETNEIFNLPFNNVLNNSLHTNTVVTVNDNNKSYISKHIIQGATKSFYSELFSEATTNDVRKKNLEEDINSKLNKTVYLESSSLIANERFKEQIEYITKFSVEEKLQTVGNLKIIDVPYIDKIYTRDIINKDNRNYDINYGSYENINEYETEVIINIKDGTKFVEVPESKNFVYKDRTYSLQYELLKPNSLKITRKAKTSWEDITVSEYPEFKKFVFDIIEAEEQIIGYK